MPSTSSYTTESNMVQDVIIISFFAASEMVRDTRSPELYDV